MFGIITPAYFRVMKIPFIQGRMFTEGDYSEKSQVAVINEKMARTLWPNQNPLGKRFQTGLTETAVPRG